MMLWAQLSYNPEQKRTMGLTDQLKDKFATGTRTYRCGFCSQPLDRERLNCPACGSSEIVAD
jgi:rubrerythrin